MNAWKKWLRQPQSLLLRRFLFQVHLWIGVALALYVVFISVTGSLLVYRREMAATFGPVHVAVQEHRLTREELADVAERAFPGFTLAGVFSPRLRGQVIPDQAVEIQLRRGEDTIERLLDPYTGADLGTTNRPILAAIVWLADLHDDLLGGRTGRLINGVGAILATLLACTGAILWWPGIRNWRRSLTIDWKRKRYAFNWSLHNAVGFWMLIFVLLWGISAIYFSFPQPFNQTVDYFEPLDDSNNGLRVGDVVLTWLARLHFGRFSGLTVKTIWTVLGLAPALLAITGVLMWWQRSVRRNPRSIKQPAPAPSAAPELQTAARSFQDKPGEAV